MNRNFCQLEEWPIVKHSRFCNKFSKGVMLKQTTLIFLTISKGEGIEILMIKKMRAKKTKEKIENIHIVQLNSLGEQRNQEAHQI